MIPVFDDDFKPKWMNVGADHTNYPFKSVKIPSNPSWGDDDSSNSPIDGRYVEAYLMVTGMCKFNPEYELTFRRSDCLNSPNVGTFTDKYMTPEKCNQKCMEESTGTCKSFIFGKDSSTLG